jgi:putative membrane protein
VSDPEPPMVGHGHPPPPDPSDRFPPAERFPSEDRVPPTERFPVEGRFPPAERFPSEDRRLLSTPSRQSPVAVVFIGARFLRNLGAVNLAVLFVVVVSGRVPVVLFGVGLVAVVVGLVFMLLAWWRFVFAVEGGELLVSKGVLAQERLTIPLDRVQSVSINQRFLHRLIGIVSVSVDTAGGAEAELEIDAVDRGRAEALQRLAAGHRRSAGPPPPGSVGPVPGPDGSPPAAELVTADEETLVARRPVELVRMGLARWPWAGLAALAPLIAFADEFADLLPIDVDGERIIGERLPDELGREQVGAVILVLVVALVAGAALGVVLQMLRVLVTDWDLRLTRTSTGLRRTAGLFSTTSRASTVSRIQAVRTLETPMQRLFGIRQLSLPTIGHGDLVIPGTTEAEIERIRAEVYGGVPRPALDRRISRLHVFLAVRNQFLVSALLAVVLVLALGWWGLSAFALVPIRWSTAHRHWRLRRWGIASDRIIESIELVDRRTGELELIKAQTVEVRRSFFERRRGLATVRITAAEGHLAVPLIPLAEAEAVRDLVLFRVESDRRAWM